MGGETTIMGDINNRTFNKKYPGKRVELIKFLRKELKRLKKFGWPEYDVGNIALMFTKHIINILEEN